MVKATIQILKTCDDLPDWPRFKLIRLDIGTDIEELHVLTGDLDRFLNRGCEEPGFLAALNGLDCWII